MENSYLLEGRVLDSISIKFFVVTKLWRALPVFSEKHCRQARYNMPKKETWRLRALVARV